MSETTRAADDLRVVRKLLWEVLSERLHPAERQEVGCPQTKAESPFGNDGVVHPSRCLQAHVV